MAVVTNLEAVHREVTDIMKRHYGGRLVKIVLYGSYARGDFNDSSDVDYLVVLNDENVSAFGEVSTTIADRNAYYLETFITISTVAVSLNQFLTSNRIFYREVRRDGIDIYDRGSARLHQESRSIFS